MRREGGRGLNARLDGLDAAAQNSLKDTTERNRSDMVMAGDMERDQRERKSIHLPSKEISPHFLIRSGWTRKMYTRRREIYIYTDKIQRRELPNITAIQQSNSSVVRTICSGWVIISWLTSTWKEEHSTADGEKKIPTPNQIRSSVIQERWKTKWEVKQCAIIFCSAVLLHAPPPSDIQRRERRSSPGPGERDFREPERLSLSSL
jgi:hypothetical protein